MCDNCRCPAVCWVSSVTGQFNTQELMRLQYTVAPNLIEALKASSPIVILRALMELHGHKAFDKLREVGADETISQMWRGADVENFSAGAGYKWQLEIFFGQVSPEPYG